MNLINNINIKVKLNILFLILCVSIAILAYKAIVISEHNKLTLKEVHAKSQAVLNLQNKIITPLYRLRELSQSLVMAPNKTIRKDIDKNLIETLQKLEKQFELLKDVNKKLLIKWKNYKNDINKTKNYLEEEFEEGAYINVNTSSREQFTLLLDSLLKIQSEFLNKATEGYKKANKETKNIKIEILIVIISVLILAIIIGWLISSNIINSIYTVQNGLRNFFLYLNNNSKTVKKIEINSKDEFFDMADMINKNVSNIQKNIEQNMKLIKNATKVLEDIKGGNLGSRLYENTNNAALNELKVMMNDMIDNLETKIQEQIDKRLEQEQLLIQQSKLASMGEMIGNIAHQWRQPLAQISAIHMNMKVTYDFNKFSKEYLNSKIKEANTLTKYMSQTIADFQNFFKPHGEKEDFSVEKACKDAFFIIESSLKYHGIEVKFDVKKDCFIYGYKNEYSQVILNVLSNAKDVFIERKVKKS